MPGDIAINSFATQFSVTTSKPLSVDRLLKTVILTSLMYSSPARASAIGEDMRSAGAVARAEPQSKQLTGLPESFTQAQKSFPNTYSAIEGAVPFNDILEGINTALESCDSNSSENIFYTRSTTVGDFILCKSPNTEKHEDQVSIQFKFKGTDEAITLAKIGKEVRSQPGYYKFLTANSCDVIYSRMDQTCYDNIAKKLAQDVLPLVGTKTSDEQLAQAISKVYAPYAQQFEGLASQCSNTAVIAVEGLTGAEANSIQNQYSSKVAECKREQGNTRMIVPFSWAGIQAITGSLGALFSAFEAGTLMIGGPAWQPGLGKHDSPEQNHITE